MRWLIVSVLHAQLLFCFPAGTIAHQLAQQVADDPDDKDKKDEWPIHWSEADFQVRWLKHQASVNADLFDGPMCISVGQKRTYSGKKSMKMVMQHCSGVHGHGDPQRAVDTIKTSQIFEYDANQKQIKPKSNKEYCLDADDREVHFTKCDDSVQSQHWLFDEGTDHIRSALKSPTYVAGIETNLPKCLEVSSGLWTYGDLYTNGTAVSLSPCEDTNFKQKFMKESIAHIETTMRVEDAQGKATTGTAATAASDANLPEGWTSAVDPSSGKTYYYNGATGQSQWTIPTAADAAATAASDNATSAANVTLPSGWVSATDPSSGKTYYYNSQTKKSQWTIPTASAASLGTAVAAVANKAAAATEQSQQLSVQSTKAAAKIGVHAAAALDSTKVHAAAPVASSQVRGKTKQMPSLPQPQQHAKAGQAALSTVGLRTRPQWPVSDRPSKPAAEVKNSDIVPESDLLSPLRNLLGDPTQGVDLSIPASLTQHVENANGEESDQRWQVELASKPGFCLSGKKNSDTPGSWPSASLELAPCQADDLHQLFGFAAPSSQVVWAAQPHLCLDEESADILPCVSTLGSSRRQVFAFSPANHLLISGSQPDSCVRIDWDGATLNPCNSEDPWQRLRAKRIHKVSSTLMRTER